MAATAHLATEAGIGVFATGGLGGVHRGAAETFDESADLTALSRLPITIVAAGVKSIVDVGATLERMESLGIAVVGYGLLLRKVAIDQAKAERAAARAAARAGADPPVPV